MTESVGAGLLAILIIFPIFPLLIVLLVVLLERQESARTPSGRSRAADELPPQQ